MEADLGFIPLRILVLFGLSMFFGCEGSDLNLPEPPAPPESARGAVREALEDQLALINKQPNNIDHRAQLARLYQANNMLRPALVSWAQVLEAEPNRAEFWYTSALAHQDAGDYTLALEAAAAARALEPSWSVHWWRPAFWELDLGRPEQAAILARESMRLAPNDVGGHIALAISMMELDQPRQSIGILKDLQAKTDHPYVRYLLGMALQRAGESSAAQAYLETGNPNQPNFQDRWHRKLLDARRGLDAQLDQIDRLLDEGRLDEAIAVAHQTQSQWPDDVNVLHRRSECYRRRGDLTRWLLDLKQAQRLEPENAITHLNLSMAYQEQDNVSQAMSHARSAVRYNRTIPEAHLQLARLLITENKIPEAATTLDEAFRLGIRDPRERLRYAHVLLRAGRLAEAENQAVQVTLVTPDNPLAWGVLAEVRYSQGRIKDAMEALRIGLKAAPGHTGLLGLQRLFQQSRPTQGPAS